MHVSGFAAFVEAKANLCQSEIETQLDVHERPEDELVVEVLPPGN